jgi:hypothetical protein
MVKNMTAPKSIITCIGDWPEAKYKLKLKFLTILYFVTPESECKLKLNLLFIFYFITVVLYL